MAESILLTAHRQGIFGRISRSSLYQRSRFL